MPTLPSILTAHDLPEAELCAATLDGELYRVGRCFSAIDAPAGASQRAQSLASIIPKRIIAERRTAAWILGALLHLPQPLELCVTIQDRARTSGMSGATIREVVIDDTDVLTIAGVRLTSPVRTALDIARFDDEFCPASYRLVADLLRLGDADYDTCRSAIRSRTNLPFGIRALERIDESLRASRPTRGPGD